LLKGLLTRDHQKRWGGEQVRAWLAGQRDIPVFYQTGPQQATQYKPYKFLGKDCGTPAELAREAGQSKNWDEALKILQRRYIQDWVKQDVRDFDLLSKLQDIEDDKNLDWEQRLCAALLVLDSELPLCWRGEIVTPDWMTAQAVQSTQSLTKALFLLASSLPQWLQQCRNETWMLEMRQRRQRLQTEVGRLGLNLARPDVDRVIFLPFEAVSAEANRRRGAVHSAATDADQSLNTLLRKPQWNEAECVAVVVCPLSRFLTKEQHQTVGDRAPTPPIPAVSGPPPPPTPPKSVPPRWRPLTTVLLVLAVAVALLSQVPDRDLGKSPLKPVTHTTPGLADALAGARSAYKKSGDAKRAKGDFNGAITDYSKAIELKPDDYDAYNNRGIAKLDKRDFDGAVADCTKAIDLKPDLAIAYNNRGIAKTDKGDFDGAIADCTKAIAIKPDSVEAYNSRGIAKGHKGDFDGAITDYSKAIELKPDYVSAYNNLGFAKRNKGDRAGAIAALSKAIELKPDYWLANYIRAWVRYESHDFTGALFDFRKLSAMSLANPYVHYGVWLVRTRQGEAEAAKAELETYLAARTNGKPGDWPSKIGSFLVGLLLEPEFLAAGTNGDQVVQRRQLCEAYFYAGSKRLFSGDKKTAIDYFQKCIATDQKEDFEYCSAVAELTLLNQDEEIYVMQPGPQAREAVVVDGVLTAAGSGKHKYNITRIDTRLFGSGGTLVINISLLAGAVAGSFDLFAEDATIPTDGRAQNSLAHLYDLQPNRSGTLTYHFTSGQMFKFGAEGNWFSAEGGTNSFQMTIRVE
jgi:lipoprotein NlpI